MRGLFRSPEGESLSEGGKVPCERGRWEGETSLVGRYERVVLSDRLQSFPRAVELERCLPSREIKEGGQNPPERGLGGDGRRNGYQLEPPG
jgi:hypothetical protein